MKIKIPIKKASLFEQQIQKYAPRYEGFNLPHVMAYDKNIPPHMKDLQTLARKTFSTADPKELKKYHSQLAEKLTNPDIQRDLRNYASRRRPEMRYAQMSSPQTPHFTDFARQAIQQRDGQFKGIQYPGYQFKQRPHRALPEDYATRQESLLAQGKVPQWFLEELLPKLLPKLLQHQQMV